MVAEVNETQSKQKAQHTKEEIKALENFLRLRFGMTSTEVSSVWRKYGTAQIARMQQEVYEEDIANALQHKAETQAEDLMINEGKQLKQSEETLTTKELKQSDKTLITKEGSHKKQEGTLIPTELTTGDSYSS